MTVKELRTILNVLPDDMEIQVGCDGHANYHFDSRHDHEYSQNWNSTRYVIRNGYLFITDSSEIPTYNGDCLGSRELYEELQDMGIFDIEDDERFCSAEYDAIIDYIEENDLTDEDCNTIKMLGYDLELFIKYVYKEK